MQTNKKKYKDGQHATLPWYHIKAGFRPYEMERICHSPLRPQNGTNTTNGKNLQQSPKLKLKIMCVLWDWYFIIFLKYGNRTGKEVTELPFNTALPSQNTGTEIWEAAEASV